jgi:hypothetical protein
MRNYRGCGRDFDAELTAVNRGFLMLKIRSPSLMSFTVKTPFLPLYIDDSFDSRETWLRTLVGILLAVCSAELAEDDMLIEKGLRQVMPPRT